MSASKTDEGAGVLSRETKDVKLCADLKTNIRTFESFFENDDTLNIRNFQNFHCAHLKGCIIYLDGMIDAQSIELSVLRPLIRFECGAGMVISAHEIIERVLETNRAEVLGDFGQMLLALLEGNTLLLLEGTSDATAINAKGFKTRAITDSFLERYVWGPQEAFTESLITNTTLLRRKIKSPSLKIKFLMLGTLTNTKVCVCYIEGVVKESILETFFERIKSIDIDGVLRMIIYRQRY